MPPRKRTLSKHPKPESPKQPKPFRSEASNDSVTPEVKLVVVDTAQVTRRKRLSICIGNALNETALIMRPLHDLISEYAVYLVNVSSMAESKEVDGARALAINDSDRLVYKKDSPFVGRDSFHQLWIGHPEYRGMCGTVLRDIRVCISMFGQIYAATSNAVYQIVEDKTEWITGCDGGTLVGYADGSPSVARLGLINGIISNHNGSALIISDRWARSIRRITIADKNVSTVWRHHNERGRSHIALALDRSGRFGSHGVYYFARDSVTWYGAGLTQFKRMMYLHRQHETDTSIAWEFQYEAPGSDACTPFESGVYGLECAPNGTVLVHNSPQNSMYAIDPSSGAFECLLPRGIYAVDLPVSMGLAINATPNWIDWVVMHCELSQPYVRVWNHKSGLVRCELPVEFWEKPKQSAPIPPAVSATSL